MKGSISYYLFFLLISFLISCKNDRPENEKIRADISTVDFLLDSTYLIVPNEYYKKGNYDSAAYFYDLAANRYLEEEKYLEFFSAISNEALQFIIDGKTQTAIDKLNQGSPYLIFLDGAELILSKYCYSLGLGYYYLNKADSSEKYLLKALKLQVDISSKPSLEKVNTYMNLGKLYSYLFLDIRQGQKYYEQALNEMHQLTDSTHQNVLYNIYYSMANNSRQRKNLDKAEYYALSAIEIGKKQEDELYQEYGHNLLASIYYTQQKYEKSIREYETLIELENKSNRVPYLMVVSNYNLGLIYSALRDYKTSINHLQKALTFLKKNNFENIEFESEILANIGKSNYLNKNFELGESSFKRCLDLANQYGKGHEIIGAKVNRIIGDSYFLNKDYEKALFHFSGSFDIIENYYPGNSLNLFELLSDISQIQFTLGRQSQDEELLKHSLDNFLRADSIMQQLRRSNYLESDEIWLNNQYQKFYESGLECIGLLYQLHPEKKLILSALGFIEQNKSRVLSRSIKNAELLQSAGVPNDLVQQWSDLKFQIAEWQSKIKDGENRFAEKQLIHLNEQLELVNYQLENRYKSYAELRIKPVEVVYDSIVNIARKDSSAIMSFFSGNDHLTALTILPDSSFLNFVKPDSAYQTNLLRFRDLLENPDPTSFDQFQLFKSLSYYFYQLLIEPSLTGVNPRANIKNVVIIPDKNLTFIPFEALILDTLKSDNLNYKSLSYLIKLYQIHYQNSHYFLQKTHTSLFKDSDVKFGGWGYEKLPGDEISLPNTKIELNHIAGDFDSKIFFNESATETNFKQYSDSYNILHMSIHGTISSDSLQPSLLFYPDGQNDGKIFPHELFNLKLHAQLAVLSACETGLGKIEPGEGVQNLSRGFFYSGCSNVIMSLWQINDQSTFKIQDQFYRNLKRGEGLSSSLSDSKLHYISNADSYTSHPSYWSSMILVGSAEPIIKENSGSLTKKMAVIISIFIITAFFIVLIRSRY